MTYCETVQIQSAAEVSGVRHMDAGNDAGGVTENQKTSPGPDRSCRTDCNIGSTDSGSGSTAATAEHTADTAGCSSAVAAAAVVAAVAVAVVAAVAGCRSVQ